MLPNSNQFLCVGRGHISPYSEMFRLHSSPYNIVRRSKSSFLVCDNFIQQNKVQIFDMNASGERTAHLDFENFAATRWDSFDDQLLMINSEGDLVYLNLNSKCIDLVKKQHPGDSVCIVNTGTEFITAGGYVKSLSGDQSERIIKIWGIDKEDKLECKGRFGTGHTRPIEYTMMMNRSVVVTLSKDKTIRISDINHEATIRTLYTPTEQPLSACQLNYDTLIYGGNRPYLNIVDTRTRKQVCQRIALQEQLAQVNKIVRFSESQIVLCNVNFLMILDLKTMKIRERAQVQGETIWALEVLDPNHFVIGNRGRFVQVWEVCASLESLSP